MSLLVRTLTDALSASKFLVVMDDIWSDEAWSNVLCIAIRNASRNKPGSRVLVTTRLKDLASKMGESFHQHHVSPLDKEDAWSLLKKQLTPNQVSLYYSQHFIFLRCAHVPNLSKIQTHQFEQQMS